MEQSTGEKSNSDPLVPKDTGDNICMLVDGVVLNSQSIADLQHANMTLRDNNNQIMDLLRQITQDFADMRAKKILTAKQLKIMTIIRPIIITVITKIISNSITIIFQTIALIIAGDTIVIIHPFPAIISAHS